MEKQTNRNLQPWLGALLPPNTSEMPMRNADGLAVPELTEEQRYAFDTHGWFLVPEVFTGSELKEMRDFG